MYSPDDPNLHYFPLACCVRFDRRVSANSQFVTTPRILEDASHYNVGFASVEVNADGDLELHTALTRPVGSINVNADETLVRRGIAGGGSGGSAIIVVRFSQNGQAIRADGPEIYGSTSNVWVHVDHYEWGTP